MKLLITLFLFYFFLPLSVWSVDKKPAALNVRFDLDNARMTIQLLRKKQVSQAELEQWVNLRGTRALISKLGSTPAIACSALQKAIEKKKADAAESKFQFATIHAQLDSMTLFIEKLHGASDSIVRGLVADLSAYQTGQQDTVVLYGLVGGYSAGFAFTKDKTSFYMGLHFYKGDITGVAVSARHELFHTIQTAAYNYEPVMEKLRQKDSGWEAPYYLLRHLYLEGSAEFVADNEPYLTASPYLKREYEHSQVNIYRHEAVFYLIEHMLLDARDRVNDMDFGQLYSILFDWNWNNPAYYAGKHMMSALVKEYGRDYIQKSLQRDALYFINDYIDLVKKQRVVNGYSFSDTFQAMITAMLQEVERQKAATRPAVR